MSEKKLNEAALNVVKTLQEASETIAESAVAAQERNVKYVQSTIAQSVELLKSHAGSTQALIHELEERTRKQQEAFQGLVHESSEAYMDYFLTPLTYYRKALDAVETATRQGLETFEKATETFQKSSREGLEAFQKYAHQVQHDTQEATK